MTECSQTSFHFATEFRREAVVRFDGGTITTEAGALLPHETEHKTGIPRRFARCFRDDRKPELIEHSVAELVRQRVYGLALGYEDLNDHDQLRADPLLAMLAGKADIEGRERRRQRDRGQAGAGKSTLNRLELTPADADQSARYKKIALEFATVDQTLVELYVQRQPSRPKQIVLDLDAARLDARALYEDLYCARGEMENRIKEQQLDLFADRASTSLMRSNQIRLYFSSIAYCLLQALRELGLKGTRLARAQCSTIRVRLLKIGARVRLTARKVWISMATGHPAQGLFAAVYANLERAPPLGC